MLLFRSEEHINRWCRAWRFERGGSMSTDTCWQLADAWYGPGQRSPEWKRRTLEETETLLASLGLSGPFWSLR